MTTSASENAGNVRNGENNESKRKMRKCKESVKKEMAKERKRKTAKE